tara:strand:- start:945 stop:2288 length:1344 start_codon:yes stop_codon:yes gene_type:complete
MALAERFEKIIKAILPAPFSIAVLLTFITFILALFIAKPQSNELQIIQLLSYWEKGLWHPPLLVFAIQMMLMLVLGHVLALSRPFELIIEKATVLCSNSSKAAAIITFSTLLVSFFNWGLGLIFGAIFARKVGEYARSNNISINYPLIGAAGYSGLMVWHGGISGSAPIKIAEEGHFLSDTIGVISQADTIFSNMNICVSLLLIIILPIVMYYLGLKSKDSKLPKKTLIVKKSFILKGAEKIDHSKIIAYTFGSMILYFAIYKALILPVNISLSIISPNFINLILLGLSVIMHSNVYNFLRAVDKAISGSSGILIQFPLYFGIMGIMNHSGMVQIMSDFFVTISNETTLPIFTFISAGIVNIFVPSGGGQWAIQGPIIVDACVQLGVSIPKSVMALAYGDQITNMLQPFWALPLLGITGLKAREILPYTLIIMLVGLVIFISGLLFF